ncbi:hypothetical protein RYA05_04800 [Pseudomonas syringae pv. actinidiae]|nr:hypothetical protein [Pseudomonas syringae pv. actinidiae]
MKHQEHILSILASSIHDQMPVTEESFIGMYPVELHSKDLFIAQRAVLEKSPEFRQPIKYAAVRCGNRYAAYRRKPSGSEAGLHGMMSIGFGGHADVDDLVTNQSVVNLEETLQRSMVREIEEELDLNGAKVIGFTPITHKIISNKTPVDSVHIGLVAVVEIDEPIAKAGENQLDFLGFFTLDELALMENPENWTAILIEYLRS